MFDPDDDTWSTSYAATSASSFYDISSLKRTQEWGSDGVAGTVACESSCASCASKAATVAWAFSVRFLAASRNLDMAQTWDSLGTTWRFAKVVLVYLTFPFGTIANDLFGLMSILTFSYMNPTVSEQMSPLSQYDRICTKFWSALSTCQYGRSTCWYSLSTCPYILSTGCPRVVHGSVIFRIFFNHPKSYHFVPNDGF